MNVMPITPTSPACFGTCCPIHARCARYQAVDGTRTVFFIATCSTDGDKRPLFLSVEEKQ
jgi:hypothetical protein